MRIDGPIFTGSFSYNGLNLSDLAAYATTGSNTFYGNQTINGVVSASYFSGSTCFDTITNKPTLFSGSSQALDILTSLNSYTASNDTTNTTQNSRLTNIESKSASVDISVSNINSFTASNGNTSLNSYTSSQDTKNATLASYTGSNDTKWTTLTNVTSSLIAATGSYSKLTGGNTFTGTQIISASVYVTGDLVVQGSSSIQYISASSVSIGTNIVNLNTATPAVRFAGISVQDSGSSAGVTGSILWDSVCNKWIYSNPSGVGYSGGMLISGPRNTGSIGNETGLTCNYLATSIGSDHISSSAIYHDPTVTCVLTPLVGNSTACFASNICTPSIGLASGGSINNLANIQYGGYTWGNYNSGDGTITFSNTTSCAVKFSTGPACFANTTCFPGAVSSEDVRIYRSAGTTTGYINFGSTGTNYFGFDGTKYVANGTLSSTVGLFSTCICTPAIYSGCIGIGTAPSAYSLKAGGRGYFFATNQDAGWGMLTLDYGNGDNSSIYAIQMLEGGATNAAIGYGSYNSSSCGDIVIWTNNGSSLTERMRIFSTGITCFANIVCTPQLWVQQDSNSEVQFLTMNNANCKGTASGARMDLGNWTNQYALTFARYGLCTTGNRFGDCICNTTSIFDNAVSSNGMYIGVASTTGCLNLITASTKRITIAPDGTSCFGCRAIFYVPESNSNITAVGVVGVTCGKAVYIGANCTYGFVQSHGSVPLRINELGNDVIIAIGSNNVGIGCTSPGFKLDVNGIINSGDTNGFAIGAVSGRRRIQHGSTAANSFTLLTDGNGYADLYANAVCAIGASVYAATNIRVGSGTSVGNSTDPAITAGGCTKAGIYFDSGGVAMGAKGQAIIMNSNGTLQNTSTAMFGSNGLWHQSVGGIRFNGNSVGNGAVIHIKTNIYHQNSVMIGGNIRGYEYAPNAVDTDFHFYTYAPVGYVYSFGTYVKAYNGWGYGAYYSSDDYVVLYVCGLGSYAGFTLNFNNTALLQNAEVCVRAWTAVLTTAAQY